MKKHVFRRAACAVVCAVLAMLPAVPAVSEDGFISNAGIFEYLTPPDVRPNANPSPHDGWIGVYYAPGVGLEMNIWDLNEGEGVLHCSIINYANPYENAWDRINDTITLVGDEMRHDDVFALRNFNDGRFTLEISDEYVAWLESRGTPFYGNPTSIEFIDVTQLMADPAEDRYGGAYFYDVMEEIGGAEVYTGDTIYLSVVQLYGTRDYFTVRQCVSQGVEQTEYASTLFYSEADGMLIHDYGYSPVIEARWYDTLELFDDEPQKVIRQRIMEAGVESSADDDHGYQDYYWCSIWPMWGN